MITYDPRVESLQDILERLRYTLKKCAISQEYNIHDAYGAFLYRGTLTEIWAWLQETKQVTRVARTEKSHD